MSWQAGRSGRSGKDNRLFVEAVLWIARTGTPWRDLPSSFGHWNSTFTRFRDWVKADIWKRLFDAVSDDPDMEYAIVCTENLNRVDEVKESPKLTE